MYIFRFVFVLSLFFLTLTGCAFTTREVTLRNSEMTTPDSASPQKVHTICFNGLEDKRPETNIGHVQNTYGTHTANVVALNSVPDWINTEIENQLKIAGYDVRKKCESEGSEFIINGTILKVYTTAYFSYIGEVSIKASVKVNNTILLEKEYSEHENSGTNWAATVESFRDILENSLTNSINKMILDIDSLDKTTDPNHMQSVSYHITDKSSAEESTLPELELADSLRIECPSGDGDFEIVAGQYGNENFSYSLSSIRVNVKNLYRQRFELNSALNGSICVFFEINRKGEAENSKIIENSINDIPIQERLISQLSEKHFPRPEGEQSRVGITYRLNFSSEQAKSSKKAIGAVMGMLALIPSAILLIVNLNNASRY